MDSTVVKHIAATPDVCGGKPRIAGTRIRVQDIYIWHELQGLSADEIVNAYTHLTLADVYAALAYYHDHRDDLHHDIEAGRALAESLKKHYPSKLQQKSGTSFAWEHCAILVAHLGSVVPGRDGRACRVSLKALVITSRMLLGVLVAGATVASYPCPAGLGMSMLAVLAADMLEGKFPSEDQL